MEEDFFGEIWEIDRIWIRSCEGEKVCAPLFLFFLLEKEEADTFQEHSLDTMEKDMGNIAIVCRSRKECSWQGRVAIVATLRPTSFQSLLIARILILFLSYSKTKYLPLPFD